MVPCLLRFNEFPTEPASFSGTIEKKLPGCKNLPAASYQKIDSGEIDVSKFCKILSILQESQKNDFFLGFTHIEH